MKPRAMKPIPHRFVLEELADLQPITKAMFGALAVYVSGKIVFILRDREKSPEDNGIWIATIPEHHESLRRELPCMRSLKMFGPGPTGWQVIPVDAEDFEESTLHACALVKRNDPRIGKTPKDRRGKKGPRAR